MRATVTTIAVLVVLAAVYSSIYIWIIGFLAAVPIPADLVHAAPRTYQFVSPVLQALVSASLAMTLPALALRFLVREQLPPATGAVLAVPLMPSAVEAFFRAGAASAQGITLAIGLLIVACIPVLFITGLNKHARA